MPLTAWIAFLGPHLTFDFLFWLIPFLCFPIPLVQDFLVLKKKLLDLEPGWRQSPEIPRISESVSRSPHPFLTVFCRWRRLFTRGRKLGTSHKAFSTNFQSAFHPFLLFPALYICMQNFSQDHWRQLPKFTPFIYLKFFLKYKVKFLILFDLIVTLQ